MHTIFIYLFLKIQTSKSMYSIKIQTSLPVTRGHVTKFLMKYLSFNGSENSKYDRERVFKKTPPIEQGQRIKQPVS